MRHPKPAKFYLIRPRDQVTLTIVLGSLLVMIWAYWRWSGGPSAEFLDLDEAPHLEARFLVDINQAEWPELLQLPDIGRTLAQRIVNDRQINGPFISIDDLDRVNGIGPHTIKRIGGYLLFAPPSAE